MDFDNFMAQAWDQHPDDPAGVAARLGAEGVALLTEEGQLPRLIELSHHVHGAHLAQWDEGLAQLRSFTALRLFAAEGASGQTLRRCTASLKLCAGAADALQGLGASDRVRAAALAAANLCDSDAPRALRLFQQALAEAETAGLPDADPAIRSLAANGNALACAMEDKPQRSTPERELMILAAQAARRCWERAGTWLQVERAEYRLAKTWLQAGDPAQARQHARLCLEIVHANDGAALERFFGWEALGVVERGAGNTSGHAQALAQARTAFAALSDDDRPWCQPSLDGLAAPATAPAARAPESLPARS